MLMTSRTLLSRLAITVSLFVFTATAVVAQTSPQAPNPELAPAIQLIRDGDSKKAVDALKRAVKKNKADGVAWYYLGIAYLQVSEFKKASDAFQKAIAVQPDLAAPAHAGYAYALVLRNRLIAAEQEANKALAIDPKNIEAIYTLGILDLRKNARDEALKKADQLIELRPDFPAAYLLKSQALVSFSAGAMYPLTDEPKQQRQLKYREALEALEKYLNLETDPVVAEPWNEQVETLKFFVEDSPDKPAIYTGRDVTTKARLLAKPEPTYTESARNEQIAGTVVLRCVFAADGTVKHILVMQSLPRGLTEQSIAAAKQIRFIPATRDGKPVSMWMQLEYNYNLY